VVASSAVHMGVSAELDDLLGSQLGDRLDAELRSSLRRRPVNESRLGGALQLLAPHSARLRESMLAAFDVLVRRGAHDRPLYLQILRGLVASEESLVAPLLAKALSGDESPPLGTIAAAAICKSSGLQEPLLKISTSRSPHIAFAGELALIARGESSGQSLANCALRMKESYRLEICTSLVLPLVRVRKSCPGATEGIRVMRDSERHLGRWLLFALLAHQSGDCSPLSEARENALKGPSSARAAWNLVVWALKSDDSQPSIRPTLEIVARLSDRPSAERDLSFLFRMARTKAPSTRAMLESLVQVPLLANEAAVRSASFLLQQEDRDDILRRLVELVRSTKREELRGLALAAVYNARPTMVDEILHDFSRSRQLQNAIFFALVRLAQTGSFSEELLSESVFRRAQLGWLD
jgi:hypothetical protein